MVLNDPTSVIITYAFLRFSCKRHKCLSEKIKILLTLRILEDSYQMFLKT